jgi:pimeloyl-ACP methyl ester carboxylesterase
MECEFIYTIPGKGNLGYVEYGNPEGFPLVFHHGWPGSHLHGSLLHEAGLSMGIRVLAVDRPGIGGTSLGLGGSVYDFAAHILDLADGLKIERFHVLGVSGGGPYALACAALFPNRLAGVGVCCGLPPLDNSPAAKQNLHVMYRLMMTISQRSPGLIEPLMRCLRLFFEKVPFPINMLPLISILPRPDRRSLRVKANQRLISKSMNEAFGNGIQALIQDAVRLQGPWGFDLEQITRPVVFWHGGMDRNIPFETARLMIRSVRQSITHFYQVEGHYSLPMTRAGEILEHLSRMSS